MNISSDNVYFNYTSIIQDFTFSFITSLVHSCCPFCLVSMGLPIQRICFLHVQ